MKYATLYAYHGSGVSKISAGGHLFVLSDQASETAKFRAEDAERRAEYTFAASFHSGQDLAALEDEKLPLAARAMPGALARALADLLVLRGDEPSNHALASIEACRSAVKLAAWLKRASLGETAAQLFPEPEALAT